MAFIDLVEWKNMDSNTFAWRYPESNLSTSTQLLVHESQEAVLFSKGQIVGVFAAGKHTLTSENLPLIRKLYGIPFGKRNPFTVEVWFVNKRAPLNIDWSISKIMVSDPQFKYVPLMARGRYGLKVESPERFLTELVGNVSSFTTQDITQHFKGVLEQYTKNAIVQFIVQNNVPVTEVNASLSEIANSVKNQMLSFWNNYGLSLPGFFITELGIDEREPTGKKIMEAIASSSAQSIAGYTWQQQQAMNIANNAVSGQGGDMGILGMAMITGAFGGGGGGGFANNLMTPPGQQMQQPTGGYGNTQQQASPSRGRKNVFCSNCGKSYPTTSKFCPHCGNPYNPCPNCGADNDEKARRCVSCGAMLPQRGNMNSDAGYQCENCGAPITPGTKFCPNCGKKIE